MCGIKNTVTQFAKAGWSPKKILQNDNKIVRSAGANMRDGIFGEKPDQDQLNRDAEARARAEAEAATMAATDATNQKLKKRNQGVAASVLTTGAGKTTLGA